MKRHTLYILLLAVLSFSAGTSLAIAGDKARVFINPGHGGHDNNDRPSPFYNHGANDTTWYYESDSNILKGLALRDILKAKGYEVVMSRVHNTTADDLDLFEISSLAANSGADIFFAIHSNATGIPRKINHTLSIYRGNTREPVVEGSDSLARCVVNQLFRNQLTPWTHGPQVAGDWTFYSNWGPKTGLGVLRYNKLPGMLSEGSFHDYLPERARLLNADYCALEGWNLSVAIDRYFGRTRGYVNGVIAGVVTTSQLHADSVAIKGPRIEIVEAAPACGVKVELLDASHKVLSSYTTDNLYNGVYVFKALKPGRYFVRLAGNPGSERPVTLAPNASAYCNFLKP